VHRWLVPYVVSPLAEHVGRRRMWSEARRLRTLQWEQPEGLEARLRERLRSLLEHAAEHVPFYRERFRRSGVSPADVRSPTDLARLAVTTKAELRTAFPAAAVADNIPPHRRRRMMTSGSTGLPLELYWDAAHADVLIGGYLFSLEWAGLAIWDTRIAVTSPAYFYTNLMPTTRPRRWLRRLLLGERTANLPANEVTAARFRQLVATVRGRYFLRGYPSSILSLAARLQREPATLARWPAAVITFAETLTPVNAAALREAFRAPVVNYYSSWEIPQIAQSCPDNPELLHVLSDRVIVTILRTDGSPAPAGERGRVVVTDLDNYVMPFVNYALGDFAALGPPCPCGRGLPTLLGVEGRDVEVIRTLDGREINAGVLGQYLTFVRGALPYVWEYQAVQERPDSVTLRLVPTPRFSSEIAAALRRDLADLLGPGMHVTVEPVGEIAPLPSGKRPIITSRGIPPGSA
jgi:phenylacetate-coenzyme A ligase PaaK-like adenylate-forming protein